MASEPIWTEDSERILLEYSDHFNNKHYRYERRATELSQAQAEALHQLRTTLSGDECSADAAGWSLTVTYQDGQERRYTGAARYCEEPGHTIIDEDSLQPFLRTFECVTAEDGRTDLTAPTTAPTVEVGDGCAHGVRDSAWLALDVVEISRPYLLTGYDYGTAQVRLSLHDATGSTELARGSRAEGANEETLTYTFEAPGKYLIHSEGQGYLRVAQP